MYGITKKRSALARYGFAYFAYTRVSERMSSEESAIFFENLAYNPHITQNYSTFQPIATTKNDLQKVISTEVPGITQQRRRIVQKDGGGGQ